MSKFNISGRQIVITGGSGILGQQWRKALDLAGATCSVVDIQNGYDVLNPADMRRAFAVIPDAVICAAAIDAKPGTPGCARPEYVALEDFTRTIMVNLVGVQNTIQVAAQAMMPRGAGSIILVSSIYGLAAPDQRRYPHPGGLVPGQPDVLDFWKPAAYSASKAGLLGLARYWGAYLARWNVRCNAVTFGSMDMDNYDPSFRRAFEHDVPMGRFAQPGEFDGVLQWLISDASSYVTGSNVIVDGGFLCW